MNINIIFGIILVILAYLLGLVSVYGRIRILKRRITNLYRLNDALAKSARKYRADKEELENEIMIKNNILNTQQTRIKQLTNTNAQLKERNQKLKKEQEL